jgi:pimeloyl-ACP methyl ester carboxylesterase
MDGVAVSRAAQKWWASEFTGRSFMAIGRADPVLGEPVMRAIHRSIRGCPEPMVIDEGGHFLQEWGEPIARAALASWGMA